MKFSKRPSCVCGIAFALFLISAHGWASSNAVMGINFVNVQGLSTEEQETTLAQMQAANVHVIRAFITPDDKGIAFAEHAKAHGIAIEWQVEIQYAPNAPYRPKDPAYPKMYPGHPLSYADPEEFRKYFAPLLASLEAKQIQIVGFELGNEINWAAFNRDFPVPSSGRVLSLEDLNHDPEGQQIAKGYLQYLKLLAVLKEVRDKSSFYRNTPIICAGLAGVDDEGLLQKKQADVVSVEATLQFMRANGLDSLVDAYGIHKYPSGKSADGRVRQLREALDNCSVAGSGKGKPCWVTEWGVGNKNTSCPTPEEERVARINELRPVFAQYVHEQRVQGVIFFSWNTSPWAHEVAPHSTFRCGAFTEAGRLAIAPLQ